MPLPILSIVILAMSYVSYGLDYLLGTTFFWDHFSAEALNEFAHWWMVNINK